MAKLVDAPDLDSGGAALDKLPVPVQPRSAARVPIAYFDLDVNPPNMPGRRSHRGHSSHLIDLVLGPCPVEIINSTLGLEIVSGRVVLSRAAQAHAMRRHPEDYSVCLPLLSGIIAQPLYVGDDFKNPGKIEIIGFSSQTQTYILIALSTSVGHDGNFHVASFYPISSMKIQQRREKGFLRMAFLKKMGPD